MFAACVNFGLFNEAEVPFAEGGCLWLLEGFRCAGGSGLGLAAVDAKEVTGKLTSSDSDFIVE